MPARKYHVRLTDEEKAELQAMVHKGARPARKLVRARVLLKAHAGWKDARIAEALDIGRATVERTRKRFVEGGMEKALNEDPRPGGKVKVDGKAQAVVIATACSTPPAGHARWTLRLLAGRLVELKVVESVSHETIRRVLKKTTSSPGRSKPGVSGR